MDAFSTFHTIPCHFKQAPSETHMVLVAPQKHPQRRREWVGQVNTTLTLSHKYIYTSLHINVHTLKLMSSIQRLDTHACTNTHST